MEKQLLIEHIPFVETKFILVESKGGRMRIVGKLQEAEIKNGNGRVYPFETLKREVDKYIKGPIKEKTSMGELDHPDSSVINLKNASHVITKIWWEDKKVMGELELLNTPSGKIAQEIVAAGIPLGVSSRGMGSVKQIGETVEVQDDLELLCWDLVSVPSTPGAYLTSNASPNKLTGQLAEGKTYLKNYSKINSLITEIICNQTGVCHLC